MKLVRATMESIVVIRPEPTAEVPQGMCLDKGYAYDEVRGMLMEFMEMSIEARTIYHVLQPAPLPHCPTFSCDLY